MRTKFLIFIFDDAGVTAIEYALIAALLGGAAFAGGTLIGNSLTFFFKNTADYMLGVSNR